MSQVSSSPGDAEACSGPHAVAGTAPRTSHVVPGIEFRHANVCVFVIVCTTLDSCCGGCCVVTAACTGRSLQSTHRNHAAVGNPLRIGSGDTHVVQLT